MRPPGERPAPLCRSDVACRNGSSSRAVHRSAARLRRSRSGMTSESFSNRTSPRSTRSFSRRFTVWRCRRSSRPDATAYTARRWTSPVAASGAAGGQAAEDAPRRPGRSSEAPRRGPSAVATPPRPGEQGAPERRLECRSAVERLAASTNASDGSRATAVAECERRREDFRQEIAAAEVR
jgi:hypothetical protein